MTGGALVLEGIAISVSDVGDLSAARLAARSMSTAIGFDEQAVEEIALVVSELATNLGSLQPQDAVFRVLDQRKLVGPEFRFIPKTRGPAYRMWSRPLPTIFLRRGVWAAAWAQSTG